MKLNDIITIPLTKMNWYMATWIVLSIVTVIPGVLLWLITLGGFRYFNIMNKVLITLVEKDLRNNGY